MIYKKPLIDEERITEDIIWNVIRIDTRSFNLPVDIFLDESDFASSNGLPFFILFRNSYDSDSRDYMPLFVGDLIILLSNKKLNIDEQDLCKIHKWIAKYHDYIIAISKGEMYATDFLKSFSKIGKY